MSASEPRNFLRELIEEENRTGRWGGAVVTRFPPEPNGYLHVGHAKSICINFGLAAEYGGRCHLRFDDTNPTKEEVEYVESIKADILWLGFDWGEHLYFASDYFERMTQDARTLIRKGLAYVDETPLEAMRVERGTVNEAGVPSAYRERGVDDNLVLFDRMLDGGFAEGAAVLRAKIDLANPNMKMRDPAIYRVMHRAHHHVGDRWKAYPLYDFAHCLEDCYEGITHSLCTLEFENNRELYDWYLDAIGHPHHPQQTEFARLEMTYVLTSKRNLLALVQQGHVAGWDDPRMMTISGLRRRGVRPEAIRAFVERVGVAKANSTIDFELFELCVREDLEPITPRVMGVLDPLRLIIDSLPPDHDERFVRAHHPTADLGARDVPFSREVFIDREDFAEVPPAGWRRLAPGWEVRLPGAYLVTCTGVEKDAQGRIVAVHCSHDPASRGGAAPDGRKPKGNVHWVDAGQGMPIEVRLYERLFAVEDPKAGDDVRANLNPTSLRVVSAVVEPAFCAMPAGTRVQWERVGYFWTCPEDAGGGLLIASRIATLNHGWGEPVATAAAAPVVGGKGPRIGRPMAGDHLLTPTPPAEALLTPAEEALLGGAVAAGSPVELVRTVILNDLRGALHGPLERADRLNGRLLAEVLTQLAEGVVGRGVVGALLSALDANGGPVESQIDALGLRQVTDRARLEEVVHAVVAAHPDEAARCRAGESKLLGFFMGATMKASAGSADPKIVGALLRALLGG